MYSLCTWTISCDWIITWSEVGCNKNVNTLAEHVYLEASAQGLSPAGGRGGCVYKNSNLLLGGAIIINDILGLCVALYSVAGSTRWSWINKKTKAISSFHWTKSDKINRRIGMELTPRKETMYNVSDFLLISSSNVLNLIKSKKSSYSYIAATFSQQKWKHHTAINSRTTKELGRFPFDQKFRFEISGILYDEWNGIFRFVEPRPTRPLRSKFRANIQTLKQSKMC